MFNSPQTASASPFQYVPVPNELVPAVLTFLGERLSTPIATSAAPNEQSPPIPVASSADDGWTDEKLLRFSSMGTKTSETVSRILALLSDEPGKENAKSTRELAENLGLGYSVLKAVPTQVTRTLGKHFAGLGSPYEGHWGTTDFDPTRSNEMYFSVTRERAAQWKRMNNSDAPVGR